MLFASQDASKVLGLLTCNRATSSHLEKSRIAGDRVERRTQLMTQCREELALRTVRLLRPRWRPSGDSARQRRPPSASRERDRVARPDFASPRSSSFACAVQMVPNACSCTSEACRPYVVPVQRCDHDHVARVHDVRHRQKPATIAKLSWRTVRNRARPAKASTAANAGLSALRYRRRWRD